MISMNNLIQDVKPTGDEPDLDIYLYDALADLGRATARMEEVSTLMRSNEEALKDLEKSLKRLQAFYDEQVKILEDGKKTIKEGF